MTVETATPETVDEKIDRLSAEVEDMRNVLNSLLEQITVISEAVGPTLESLKNSPIFKMMGV